MIGLTYKNIHSSTYDIFCKTINRSLLPAIRRREFEIFGRSGFVDMGDNDYGTRTMSVKLTYAGDDFEDLRSSARDIAVWLNSSKWEKLIFDDEPDKYYLARVKDGIDLSNIQTVGEMTVEFECQPFAYSEIEPYQFTIPEPEPGYVFENPGTQPIGYTSPQGSKFLIIISGSWTTLEISLNGKTLEYIEAGSGELVIDNIEMTCTLDGVNKFSALDGDIDTFLSIMPGNNTIEVDGTELDVTVTIDFAPMWL